MLKTGIETPKAPIGFLRSLWKGVEAVNAHLWLLLIPVGLDAFLWLGPRLSIAGLAYPWLAMLESTLRSAQNDTSFLIPLRQILADFNLFKLLSNLPLFPPSLMVDYMPTQSPLGAPVIYPVQDSLTALGLTLALVLASLFLGSGYWVMAGAALSGRSIRARDLFLRWLRTVAAVFLLLILSVCILVGGFFLSLMVSSLIGIFWVEGSIFLMQLFLFAFFGLLFWLVLFVVFTPHGIILHQDGILRAVWNSVETSRWIYPLSMWIPILYLILNMLLLGIWSLPAQTDWLCALGVLGNAYTGSVLVMASLIYYQDKRRWIDEVRILIQSHKAESLPPTTSV
jgi:hypothetical protein